MILCYCYHIHTVSFDDLHDSQLGSRLPEWDHVKNATQLKNQQKSEVIRT